MPIDHICSESCFSNKSSQKMKVNCMCCDQAFNTKCFGITITKFINQISSKSAPSNIVFLCIKCHSKVEKSKTNRLSLDAARRRSATPSVGRTPEATITTDNVSTDNLISSMNDKLTKIINDNDELRIRIDSQLNSSNIPTTNSSINMENNDYRSLIENIMNLHAKFDQRLPNTPKSNNKESESEILSSLNSLHQKIDHVCPSNSKLSHNITHTPISKTSNPLDWTLHFNNSPITHSSTDNSDLYTLLTGFERNTWASLDHLKEKIIENAVSLASIRSDISLIHTECISKTNTQHAASPTAADTHTASPLSETINIEITHEIHNKCGDIQSKCDTINNNLNSLLENMALNAMSPNSDSYHDSSPPNDSTTQDDQLSSGPSSSSSTTNGIAGQQNRSSFSQAENSSDANIVHHTPNTSRIEQPNYITNEFCVSNFKNNTTCQMVIDHMLNNGVPNSLLNNVKIHRLVPKHRDISTLTYVSFKIDVDDEVANIISRLHFWPPNCTLKNFVHKKRPTVDISREQNFPPESQTSNTPRTFSTANS